MSEYTVVELKINDEQCLKESLKELGYVFEEHKTPVNLYGYEGSVRSQKANIIVRKNNVGLAANDVGFLKEETGSYKMIISEYDRKSGSQSKKFMVELQQVYSKLKVIKESKKLGFHLASLKKENGKIKIQMRK